MTWKVFVEITMISWRRHSKWKCHLHERGCVPVEGPFRSLPAARLHRQILQTPSAGPHPFCLKCRSILNVYFSGSSLVLLSTSSAEIKRRFKTIVARTEFELNNVSFSCFESYSLDRIKRSATFANRAWIRRRQE